MNFDPWAIVSEHRAREASDLSTAAIPPDVLVFLLRSSVWWLQNKFQTQLHRFPLISQWLLVWPTPSVSCVLDLMFTCYPPFHHSVLQRLSALLLLAETNNLLHWSPPVPVYSCAKPPTEDKAHLCLLTRRNSALNIARGCNTWSGRAKCSFADITLVFHVQSRWWNRKLKSPSL